ncbi:hypothetical protein Poli38472_013721 [Pythium oligandrum]|uniref:Uncharacterized protein n=1 Tax=Pythium oligandrum TaxID=41045 RepID=A0A8K1FK07_PYTOL|nr:hypothetical protein Poli38472_013721 [Pythium oligandrum]|eukprot:TMW61258.1 hypothetical protein Poli38472_013721 [Pythium oligandrum]
MEEDAALAALLEPWWRVFPHGYLIIRSNNDAFDFCKRLYALELPLCEPNDQPEATWRRYCEAMEILLLASMVKPLAFREMMWSKCTSLEGLSAEWFEHDAILPCRLCVEVDDNLRPWQLHALTALLSPPPHRCEAFEATRATLIKMARTNGLSLDRLVIPVAVTLGLEEQRHALPFLERLVDLQRQRLDDESRDDSPVYPFATEGVDYAVDTSFVSSPFVDITERLKSTPEMRLHCLKHSARVPEAKPDDITTRRVLLWRWAVAATGLSNDRTVIPDNTLQASGVQLTGSYRLECNDVSAESFPGLFSSMMHSKDVHELRLAFSLTPTSGASAFKWCWLIYALFNQAVSHSITSLIIDDTDIQLDDMTKVRELVRSPWPLNVLLDPECEVQLGAALVCASSEPLPTQVTLRPGAQIYLDPQSDTNPLTVTSNATTFDVMHTFKERFDIFVPGYGQCWVRHEDVETEISMCEGNAPNRWKLKTHSITKLSISLNYARSDDRKRGIRMLLKLIGRPITHLCLSISFGGVLDPLDLDHVLAYCPNLVHLSVSNVAVNSLQDIAAAYASGRCRVSELSLQQCKVRDWSNISRFIETLADPTTPIATTLRQFSLSLNRTASPITEEILEAFLAMLETNKRLRVLKLTVWRDQFDRFSRRFAVFNGQSIRYRVPVRVKCALLSVVKHAHCIDAASGEGPAVGRLDHLALSKILFLASDWAMRSVVLKAV